MSALPPSPAATDELSLERRDIHGATVLWLTIRREARRNAMNAAVLGGIAAALDQAQADRAVRAIVLTGAGSKAFCAGADLQGSNTFVQDLSEPYAGFASLLRRVRQSNVPLVARVNGACMAGGMGLMAMCDMAVAAPHAVFGLPEVKVGVFPAQVLAVLQHLIPRRLLTELCITGEPLDATQALQAGLVNHLADGADEAALDAKVHWLLGRLLDKSPAAVRRGLYMLKRIETMSFEEAISFAESQIALFAQTEDAREGQAAFQEKRPPRWSGR